MKIPADVILLWPSTVASIPSNWQRETTYDDKFLKSCGDSVNPNTAGGASAHSHSGISHSHTRTDNHGHSVGINNNSGNGSNYTSDSATNQDPITQINHGHPGTVVYGSSGGNASDTISYPSTTNNNRPPYFEFIFIKALSGAVVAVDIIGMWNNASVPTGWNACTDGLNGAPALGNKYAKGATTGANAGGTGGSLTHTHDLTHSHTTSHTHSGLSGYSDNSPSLYHQYLNPDGGKITGQHRHTVNLASQSVTTDTYSATLTSGTVEPLYKKLLAIQRTSSGATGPRGLIGIWLGSIASIPKGWKYCNGQLWEDGVTSTPDMRDYHLKFANSTSEIGNTGGLNTHSHAASNSHTHSQTGTHTHSASVDPVSDENQRNGSPNSVLTHTHGVSSVGNNNASLSWGSASMSAESVNNEPQYVTGAFIQLTKIYNNPKMLEC